MSIWELSVSALPYELIALDLDLTFLNEQHEISPRNLAAARRCRDLGAKLIITSGRMYYTTLPFSRALELDTPTIAYNGAFIKHDGSGKVLLDEHLDIATAQELVAFCARENLHLNYYLDDTLYTAQENVWSDLYATRTGAIIHPVGDLRCFADRAPTKVLIVDDPAVIIRLCQDLSPHFAGRAYVTISNPEYLEFMPPQVDKGKALSVVAAHYGIPRAKVIAFGDANNDVPAIQWSGLGVAMANACPDVRAQADRIAPSYDEDGVAIILEEIFG
jgi:Cof subfamily protein (haloacid dehalogenase superfamily)